MNKQRLFIYFYFFRFASYRPTFFFHTGGVDDDGERTDVGRCHCNRNAPVFWVSRDSPGVWQINIFSVDGSRDIPLPRHRLSWAILLLYLTAYIYKTGVFYTQYRASHFTTLSWIICHTPYKNGISCKFTEFNRFLIVKKIVIY